tara:strand:- start:24 stop:545 length:522 start_codon:yes stop_codon:yes gene_type:complete
MKTIDIATLNQLQIPVNELVIIDIRTPDEYAKVHIPNSINIPLTQLSTTNFTQWQNKTLLFYCKAGHRTQQAESLIAQLNCKTILCLQGGINAWQKVGNKVNYNPKAPLELVRQVQIIVGIMILLGVTFAYLISPYFIILTIFAGLGLLMAGLTGFCGMAKLLMFLPYNKIKE